MWVPVIQATVLTMEATRIRPIPDIMAANPLTDMRIQATVTPIQAMATEVLITADIGGKGDASPAVLIADGTGGINTRPHVAVSNILKKSPPSA